MSENSKVQLILQYVSKLSLLTELCKKRNFSLSWKSFEPTRRTISCSVSFCGTFFGKFMIIDEAPGHKERENDAQLDLWI